ncbi:AT-rich interactive domain-containing protein 4 [Acorus calamus]|uniref:AT-rich interactive domain-containing protein 4 n=1 Tax=Acorus calamus TaxID=4465 RepID=A0AAV9E253_ACOCL|nr:AT-rich interactive domain-containing protein 4 [Acorus calamus]
MFHMQGLSKQTCSLLAVLCGRADYKHNEVPVKGRQPYPFPELVSSGRLEVQTLMNPSVDEFLRVLGLTNPNFVYFQGEQLVNEGEIGSLVWRDVKLSSPEVITGLFGSTLPTIVYLEIPNGESIAEALYAKGIPYVIYWKNTFSSYAACHFRQALLSVVQSSCSHTWDAFQLANASFRLYCVRNNYVCPVNSEKSSNKLGPHLLGEAPKINVILPEKDMGEEDDEGSPANLSAIKIYDDDINMKFLVCGVPCTLDACLLGALEDGLNALLSIEIRGSKLHNRVSAAPPPLQAGAFSRGVVTMRCDITTCSSAHISLLVSGSAQTCFDDQLLESHIKNELVEKSQLVHALPSCEENSLSPCEPRRSESIACGASVFEACMKVPTWAAQVLRQLAPEVSYRSFVSLGIASIQGSSVASFEKEDAERLLFFCTRPSNGLPSRDQNLHSSPSWLRPPAPSGKRSRLCSETSVTCSSRMGNNGILKTNKVFMKENQSIRTHTPLVPIKRRLKVATMRPVPHTQQHKMMPFLGNLEPDTHDGSQGRLICQLYPL